MLSNGSKEQSDLESVDDYVNFIWKATEEVYCFIAWAPVPVRVSPQEEINVKVDEGLKTLINEQDS